MCSLTLISFSLRQREIYCLIECDVANVNNAGVSSREDVCRERVNMLVIQGRIYADPIGGVAVVNVEALNIHSPCGLNPPGWQTGPDFVVKVAQKAGLWS